MNLAVKAVNNLRDAGRSLSCNLSYCNYCHFFDTFLYKPVWTFLFFKRLL